MKKSFFKFLTLLMICFGCSRNAYQDLASSDPDGYLLIQAQAAINSVSYDSAIQILTVQVSASSQAKPNFKQTLATAYAGQCGLNFANFVSGLAAASSGTAFRLLMTPFVGIVSTPASCLLGLNMMESIAPTASRTTNQNAFVSVLGMALMGSQTRTSADTTPANGDGVVDVNLCNISDPDTNNIILGFGFMSKNFSALSTQQLGSSSQTTLSNIISQCTAVAGSTCSITDPTLITASIRHTIRSLLNTVEYGLGSVVTNGNPVLINGACP